MWEGRSPGTIVELYSLSEQGGFHKVGIGRVSPSGTTISILEGGIENTTWHFLADTAPAMGGTGGGDVGLPPDSCDSATVSGSIICASSGVLSEEHNLPIFTVSGQSVSDSLAYTNTSSVSRPTFTPQFMYEPFTAPVQRGSSRMGTFVTNPPARVGVSFEIDGRISKRKNI